MKVTKRKTKKPRRFGEHCDDELCQSRKLEHKKPYFVKGVWEKRLKRASSHAVQDLLLSMQDHTGRAEEIHPPTDHPADKDKTADEQSIYLVGESGATEETYPPTGHPSDNDVQSIHLVLDSSDSDSAENEDADISSFVSPQTALGGQPGRLQLVSTDMDKKLLSALSRLSRQVAKLEEKLDRYLDASQAKEQKLLDRLTAMEAQINSFSRRETSKRKRRVQNPKIAETVRRLHNSEDNTMRYEPGQGLASPRNEAVTSYLLKTLAASPNCESVESDILLSACKTYYETLRRSFRYRQPDLAKQVEATKALSRSRQRRSRLLHARENVLAADEVDLWRGITNDMMSDEDEGTYDGVHGWIVRPPSFRSQELTVLCHKLQARLEIDVKYMASHRRRLHNGQESDRMPPNTYDPKAAKRHFKEHLLPNLLASSCCVVSQSRKQAHK